jgi:hypothetical protein
MGARSLRHAALAWLSRVDGGAAARRLWADAGSMTERMAALRALLCPAARLALCVACAAGTQRRRSTHALRTDARRRAYGFCR